MKDFLAYKEFFTLSLPLDIKAVCCPLALSGAAFLIVEDWTCEKCHVWSAAQILCEQIPTTTSIPIHPHVN